MILILKYFPTEEDDCGQPLVRLSHNHNQQLPPFLECTLLLSRDEIAMTLRSAEIEYLDALLSDIHNASRESNEAVIQTMNRLKEVRIGPIRA